MVSSAIPALVRNHASYPYPGSGKVISIRSLSATCMRTTHPNHNHHKPQLGNYIPVCFRNLYTQSKILIFVNCLPSVCFRVHFAGLKCHSPFFTPNKGLNMFELSSRNIPRSIFFGQWWTYSFQTMSLYSFPYCINTKCHVETIPTQQQFCQGKGV